MPRSSETRTESVARDLLQIRGWKIAKPPKGNVLWKNEYRDYPHLLDALRGKGKQSRGGDGYPDFLVVDATGQRPLIVGEAKPRESDILKAVNEANSYSEAFVGSGYDVLSAGVAGGDDGGIEVRVSKHTSKGWKHIEYRGNPIQWLPTYEETSLLLREKDRFDLQPKVPSADILAGRGDQINRILRESKIADAQRPQIIGAFMLAFWYSRGGLGTNPDYILSNVNTECKRAFADAGKPELANSLQVPEANGHLASKALDIIKILRLLNIPSLTTEHDYLGQLYEMFFRFTGGNTIGQYFTPRHITQFAADLCNVSRSDIVIDPACGTGGFLISSLSRMMEGEKFTKKQLGDFVKDHLMGFESEPTTAALCVANMILRGDGKTGIVPEDCFTSERFPHAAATVVLGNPPFPHAKTDTPPESFINRGLEALRSRGQLAMVVPGSLLVKSAKKHWRAKILKANTLKAVITLPTDLFQPYASATTALLLLERGIPHGKNARTFFARITNDGFRLRKNSRVEQSGSELPQVSEAFRAGRTIPGFCTALVLKEDTEWSPGAHIVTNEHSFDDLRDHVGFLLRNLTAFTALYAPDLDRFQKVLEQGTLTVAPYAGKKSGPRVEAAIRDSIGYLFDISYGQQELENKHGLESGVMPIISSAGTDNGCYGFFNFDGIASLIKPPFVTVPRTGSIGEAFVQLSPCGVTSDCLTSLHAPAQTSKIYFLLPPRSD